MSAHAPQASAFARRMAPLALLAGGLVAVALPALWERRAQAAGQGEAAAWAGDVAQRLGTLARERPGLWAYDELSLAEIGDAVVAPPVRGTVRLDLAGEDGEVEARAFERGGGAGEQVFAWAPVQVRGRPVARVRVGLPAEALRAEAHRVWAAAGIAGSLLAVALLTVPWLTVRRGDQRNAELWAALVEANAGLEARVVERTRALRAREVELVDLSARLVGAQEAERARISRDLHDDLGQTLTAVRLQLTAARAATTPRAVALALERALAAVDEGVEGVRRLARDLRPPALDAVGLGPALRSHAERWAANAGLQLSLEVQDLEPAPEAAEVLFRIAQEALTNVARHADGTWVGLWLQAADDGWRLVVEDDGRGLSGELSSGLGLLGARERAEQLGGYLDLEVREGGGLRLLVWLPPV